MKKIATIALIGGFVLAGCQTTDPYSGESKTSNASKGAIFGAIGGAIAGALTNTSSGEQAAKNAMIGAGIGALAGGAVGAYMDQQEAKLRERLQGTGISVTRDGDNIILNMPSDITFALGSADVNAGFYQVLSDVALVLNEFDKTIVNVDGHTDTTGSNQFNQDLSQQRAGNVGNYLIQQGVLAKRLIVTGYGETRLKVPTGDGVKNEVNRRVEIQIAPYTG